MIKSIAVKILAVSLEEGSSPYFIGIDQERVVVFEKILLSGLATYSSKEESSVEIFRNNSLFSKGTPYLHTGGHVDYYETLGLKEFIESLKDRIPEGNLEKIFSYFLKHDDRVIITKHDWQEDENPLNSIATYRKMGHSYQEVFGTEQRLSHTISNFFNITHDELLAKTVVFETKPPKEFMAHF